jgi:uncharacterized protein (TIGR03437 family)
VIRAILIAIACAAIALGQATIVIFSAAGGFYFPGPPPLVSIAPGSLFDVLLLSATIQDPTTVAVTITQLHCTCAPQSATIANVQHGQLVSAQLPPDFPVSSAQVTLAFDGQTSAPARIKVVPSNFVRDSAFERSPAAGGVTSPVQLTNPMRPGDIVTISGTGLGLARLVDVAVFIGGHPVKVLDAGPVPDAPGVDRIDFEAPDDSAIPDGCYVAFWTVVLGEKGNEASISKAAGGGACASPFGFSAAQLANLDAGGKETLGEISISSHLAGPQVNLNGDIFHNFVQEDNAEANFTSSPDYLLPMEALLADDSYFGCKSGTILDHGFLLYPPYISVGSSITISGPGESLVLPPALAAYSAEIRPSTPASSVDTVAPTIFNPGTWAAGSSGSADVPPFQVSVQSRPAILVTNYAQLTEIDSGRDLAVTWSPSGYLNGDVVVVSLFAGPNIDVPIRHVTCTAPAQAGKLTIPAERLAPLAALLLPQYNFSIRESLRPGTVAPVTVPLTNGDTAAIFFDYASTESFLVQIQ